MSLFIADLAFAGMPQLEQAKLGIILGSVIAGMVGWLTLRRAFGGSTPGATGAGVTRADI